MRQLLIYLNHHSFPVGGTLNHRFHIKIYVFRSMCSISYVVPFRSFYMYNF